MLEVVYENEANFWFFSQIILISEITIIYCNSNNLIMRMDVRFLRIFNRKIRNEIATGYGHDIVNVCF